MQQDKKHPGVVKETQLQPDTVSKLDNETSWDKAPDNHIYCLKQSNRDPFITVTISFWSRNTFIYTTALLDCGATANFVSNQFIKGLGIALSDEVSPLVRDVNNNIITPTSHNAIYHATIKVDNQTTAYLTCFRAIPMGEHRAVLGLPWLWTFNPIIDFNKNTVNIQPQIMVLSAEEFLDDTSNQILVLHENTTSLLYTNVNKFRKGDLPEVYQPYEDVFYKDEAETLPPHHKSVNHAINVEQGKTPPFGPLYNLSESELKILKEYIDTNLCSGFISPSMSSAGSPILFTKKKDGTLWLCVDYWGLNNITIKDRYPIPLISEILD